VTTILVIDDEVTIGEAVHDILELIDVETLYASSGRAGLELFQAHHAEIGGVLLDMQMPGMNGVETLEALRKYDAKVKVILISGYGPGETLRQVKEPKHVTFLQKPYRLDTLLDVVQKMLARDH
jgi:two-component system, cell cycle sensor histidine kinase and response regulator CckA